MKKFMAVIVTLVVAMLSFAPIAKGQQPNSVIISNELPNSLPIGSEIAVLDFAVSNQQWFAEKGSTDLYWELSYTNINGVVKGRAISCSRTFDTYDLFRQFGASNVMAIVYSVLKTNTDVASDVQFVATVSYTGGNGDDFGSLLIKTNIGSMDQITSNTIYSTCFPTRAAERLVMRVSGLEMYSSVVKDANPPYTYSWTSASSSVSPQSVGSPHPAELTTNNTLDIHAWCLTNAFWARFTLIANGQTNVYTQLGELVREPGLSPRDLPTQLGVSLAAGEDAVIETTCDLSSGWSVFSTITSATNSILSLPVNPPSAPQRFFRVQPNSWH